MGVRAGRPQVRLGAFPCRRRAPGPQAGTARTRATGHGSCAPGARTRCGVARGGAGRGGGRGALAPCVQPGGRLPVVAHACCAAWGLEAASWLLLITPFVVVVQTCFRCCCACNLRLFSVFWIVINVSRYFNMFWSHSRSPCLFRSLRRSRVKLCPSRVFHVTCLPSSTCLFRSLRHSRVKLCPSRVFRVTCLPSSTG